MLQAIPTLPIPGVKPNPNYTLTDGVGGVLTAAIVMVLDQYQTSSGAAIIDTSNLIGTSSDSITRPGYIIVTSTSYHSNNVTGINSPYTYVKGGMNFYEYPALMLCAPIVGLNNTLGVFLYWGGALTGTIEILVEINLMTVQYQYPSNFTQEELFEDLKTLPLTVIKELAKVNCEKMQCALKLLKNYISQENNMLISLLKDK